MTDNWAKLNPFVPSPTTGSGWNTDVTQPVSPGVTPTLTSSHDGFVWLTDMDSFYSENLAFTLQNIVVTGDSNTTLVTNVVSNAMYSASAYAYHVSFLYQARAIADDFPLVPVTGAS